MGALFGAHFELPYRRRCEVLLRRQVALWDVLHTCERDGSLDNAIVGRTALINDIPAFLALHPSVRMIGLNGKTATTYFFKKFPSLGSSHLQIVALPSSSSAHAAMTFDEKVKAWSILQDFARV
jgi:hypoxanthine-DNA glycosylase